jgi:ankyrin repeat protein
MLKTSLITLILFAICLNVNGQTLGLKDALGKKDTVLAAALISKGADPNTLDENGSSLLMQAARWGEVQTVGFLLRHGAKADQPRTSKGRTALIVGCAYYGTTEVCRLLLNNGANANATTTDGTTALMYAAQYWKADIVALLLKSGADAKMKDAKGRTAIDYANMNSVDDAIKQMLKDFKVDKNAVLTMLEHSMK